MEQRLARRRNLTMLAAGLVLWLGGWTAVLIMNRRTFIEADAEFWSVYVEGSWNPAMLAAHAKQTHAYEWVHLALIIGFVLPLVLLIVGGIGYSIYRRVKRRP